MSLFRKFFSSGQTNSDEDKEINKISFDQNVPVDEQFIFNFKRNGGKFLYLGVNTSRLMYKALLY